MEGAAGGEPRTIGTRLALADGLMSMILLGWTATVSLADCLGVTQHDRADCSIGANAGTDATRVGESLV